MTKHYAQLQSSAAQLTAAAAETAALGFVGSFIIHHLKFLQFKARLYLFIGYSNISTNLM